MGKNSSGSRTITLRSVWGKSIQMAEIFVPWLFQALKTLKTFVSTVNSKVFHDRKAIAVFHLNQGTGQGKGCVAKII